MKSTFLKIVTHLCFDAEYATPKNTNSSEITVQYCFLIKIPDNNKFHAQVYNLSLKHQSDTIS